MTIRNVNNPYAATRPTPVGPAKGVSGPSTEGSTGTPVGGTTSAPTRSDSVQISDAGRAMAGTEIGGGQRASGLSAERVAELRQKVLEGAYNSVQVVDQVAQRILQSGDL